MGYIALIILGLITLIVSLLKQSSNSPYEQDRRYADEKFKELLKEDKKELKRRPL